MVNEALVNSFGAGVSDLTQTENGKRLYNFAPYHPLQHHITIPNAKEHLKAGLQYYLGDKFQWLPAYDKVADWLTDNKGRGLLCVGTPGLGKTLLCQNILPVIINQHMRKVPNCYTAIEMTQQFEAIISKCGSLLFIDDLGTEPVEVNLFGNRRVPFNEICDTCERKGGLLVLTSNLRTTRDANNPNNLSIEERYGLRTLDRLRGITKVIRFDGPSLRG